MSQMHKSKYNIKHIKIDVQINYAKINTMMVSIMKDVKGKL